MREAGPTVGAEAGVPGRCPCTTQMVISCPRWIVWKGSPRRILAAVLPSSAMSKWINHAEAIEFLDQLRDPIVRQLILMAYGNIYTEPIIPDCDVDVLFLYRVLERL